MHNLNTHLQHSAFTNDALDGVRPSQKVRVVMVLCDWEGGLWQAVMEIKIEMSGLEAKEG